MKIYTPLSEHNLKWLCTKLDERLNKYRKLLSLLPFRAEQRHVYDSLRPDDCLASITIKITEREGKHDLEFSEVEEEGEDLW